MGFDIWKYRKYIDLFWKTAAVCAMVFAVALIARGCVRSFRDYVKSSHECSVFDMDIYVTYVYSGERDEHVLHTSDKVKMGKSVESISIVCLAPAGETGAMILHVEVTGNPGGEKKSYDKEFFRNPDKPFTVTGVECVSGSREDGTY